ncbi:hypothetical protein OH491_12110 [Termitidicoccus mucosus]|uniref:DUF3102 domain-containing protein n=1 Tax=Termitidicoccus mucosus TaxID=1184151 RepID=A0A178IPB4_9BACT|nr:hypothetical protein AW736_04380 [Opitutaceae bacterium TSB47]
MNTCERISAAEQINQLHSRVEAISSQSRTLLDEALSAAWQAGKLLLAEKHRVRKQMDAGSWLLWLEANFKGSVRTAQRYMKLARTVADTSAFAGMSLRQAYARLGIATEPKRKSENAIALQLPRHVSLSNRLVLALRQDLHPSRGKLSHESIRRDLRPLYEILRKCFSE